MTSFRLWKASLMKTLAVLYTKLTDPVAKLDVHAAIEQLRYLKSKDMSTIIYILHTLRAKHNLSELDKFIETAPTEVEKAEDE